MQLAAVQAITHEWADLRADGDGWGDALAIGPGLGRTAASRDMLVRTISRYPSRSMVLDADALTLAATDARGDAAAVIADWCREASDVICTPHPGEFARMLGSAFPAGAQERADALSEFAVRARATMLLKGTPTLIAAPDGTPPTVVARGTPLLATGGSGDLLTGIIGALLAAGIAAPDAAMTGATVHGLAAEIASRRAGVTRGLTLEAVLHALPDAWRTLATPATLHQDILCELPAPVA